MKPRSAATLEQKVSPDPASPTLEPSDRVAAFIDHLLLGMQGIWAQYASNIQVAAKELSDQVDALTDAGSAIRSIAMNEFHGRILNADSQMNAQRQLLLVEIQTFGGPWNGKILETITAIESAVESDELDIQRMIEDPTVDLVHVIRSNTAHNEMKAYLRGLKFRVQEIAP